ncbi:MAG: hypothetical protein WCV72_04800 [Patescibacteria group bacterium]|jgi:hypothetical protein
MNQAFAEPVQKIDTLLTRALGVPADLSAQFCQKLNAAPEESQKVALEMIGRKALEIEAGKKAILQKIRLIKNKIKLEQERLNKNAAEENLIAALKNI